MPFDVRKRIDRNLRPDRCREKLKPIFVLHFHRKEFPKPFVDRSAKRLLELVVEFRRPRDLVTKETRAKFLGALGRKRHEKHIIHPLAHSRTPRLLVLDAVCKRGERSAEIAEKPFRGETVERLLGAEVAVHERRVRARAAAYLPRRGKLEALVGKLLLSRREYCLARLHAVLPRLPRPF